LGLRIAAFLGVTCFPRTAFLLVAALLVWAPAAQANAILNGGFETATLANWTMTPAASGSMAYVGGHAHSGRNALWFGAIGAFDDQVFQTFATQPGQTYVIAFWVAHGRSNAANDFNVLWGGTSILALVNAPRFGYREYTFVQQAIGTTTELRFSGRDLQDFFYLDDVSVTPVLSNPEPASLIMVGSGVALLIGAARRRRRA
jgi:hypothetical protein